MEPKTDETTDDQKTDDATGSNGGKTDTPVTFTPEQEELVNKRIGEARTKAREQAKAELEAERAKADAEAETKRLEEQKEFESLAAKRADKIAELTPQAQKAQRYEAALKKHLEAQRSGLPDHIVEILDTMDPADQLEYIAKHQDKLKPAGTSGKNGIDPVGGNGNTATADYEKRRNKYLEQAGIKPD